MTDLPLAELDFPSLILPVGDEAFFSEYWEEKPLYIERANATAYAGLIGDSDFETFLSRPDLRYPAVRLAKGGGFFPPEAYSRSFKYGDEVFAGVIDIDRVQAEYRAGATIVLPALHRAWRPIADLCAKLETHLDHAVHANAYLTPGRTQGFTPHYDTHEAFVLQISGRKHWKIYKPTIVLPHRSQSFSLQGYKPQQPIFEVTLTPGDLLYLPRGFVHSAATSGGPSTHVTIGVTVYTWIELATEALLAAKQKHAFRKALPPGFASRPDQAAKMMETLRLLLGQVRDETEFEALIETFASRTRSGRIKIDGKFRTD